MQEWLQKKNFISHEQQVAKLKSCILVKGDKPNNCYTYNCLIEDLHKTTAEELAEAFKGKPENLNCRTGYQLIFEAPARFSCISKFREQIHEKEQKCPGYKDRIKQSTIIFLNPTKPLLNEEMFKF